MPITPEFVLEADLWWTTQVVLPSWRGFQSRRGAYGSQDSLVPSDGSVKIIFAPEGRGLEPLTAEEVASVVWVIENEGSISRALLESMVQEYPRLQQQYGYSDEDKSKWMPDIKSADDLRRLIGLHTLYVHPQQNDEAPYVGFEFGCTWDEEHGLGVMMCGTRIVEIGGADTAFLLWIAEKDAGTS